MTKKPAKASSRRQPTEPTTEGQRLLLEVNGTQAEIADAGGWSKQLVSLWQRGKRRPTPPNRGLLRDLYGIAPVAWACKPEGEPGGAAEEEAPLALENLSTIDSLRGLIAESRKLRRGQTALVPSEQSKGIDTEAKLLAQLARLERDVPMLEARIIKEHPLWKRIRALLLVELEGSPEAARRIAKGLEELGV